MSVYKKLMEVRLEFHKLELKKSGHNKFAGYSYFELGDFIPKAQELFFNHGLCGVVSYGADMASLTITDVDTPEHQIIITSPMAEANLKGCHPIQNLGAVETYTRRYLWVTALEIVEHDVLDSSEPIKASRITPTAGAWEAMEPDVQIMLIDIANGVKSWIEQGKIKEAVEELEYANLDNDQKIALWTRLDSKERSSIKKYNEELKGKK